MAPKLRLRSMSSHVKLNPLTCNCRPSITSILPGYRSQSSSDRDTVTPAASMRSSSLRRLFSPPLLVWAIRARTATPRVTAVSRAMATSLTSRRKMTISMLRRARVMAARTGSTP